MLNRSEFFLLLIAICINFIANLKFLAIFILCKSILYAGIVFMLTKQTSKINLISVMLCGIIQDVFEGNHFMLTSFFYLSLVGMREFKRKFLLTEGKLISISYYGASLFFLLLLRDLLLSIYHEQPAFSKQPLTIAVISVTLYCLIYATLDRDSMKNEK